MKKVISVFAIALLFMCMLGPIVRADITLTSEFAEPVKNWSFEDRYVSTPGVYGCPSWESNKGGWREFIGDIDGDGDVDIDDIRLFCNAYTKYWTDPVGKKDWEPPPGIDPDQLDCDFDADCDIDIDDNRAFSDSYIRYWTIGARNLDGAYSWYTSGGGYYLMWQCLDSDAIQAVAGQTVMFSFWFYPESVAPDVSQNNARAEIYYEYAGGNNTVYGVWIAPIELNWWKAYVTASLPSTITAVTVLIHGKPNFKAWIDLAQLTTVSITPPDTSTANPYSTDYEFVVPGDGDAQATYHHEVEVFIWSEWHNQYFGLKAIEVDDWVLNVKIDGTLRYSGSTSDPPCQPVSVDLGPLSAGNHTLEFDFVEQWVAGYVKFYVALFGDPNLGKAALTRFHVDIPDYGDSEVRYKVKTTVYFPNEVRYFLVGTADDYIDDIKLNRGPVFDDYLWTNGYQTYYNWSDGFAIPLGKKPPNWYEIEFVLGEICGSGLMDFQYCDSENQQWLIERPRARFEASEPVYHPPWLTDTCYFETYGFYFGSKWYSNPGRSDRSFFTSQTMYFNWSHLWMGNYLLYSDANFSLSIGVDCADWIGGVSGGDFGLLLGLNVYDAETSWAIPGLDPHVDDDLYLAFLDDVNVEIFLPGSAVKWGGFEYHPTGDSIVGNDWKAAVDLSTLTIGYLAIAYGVPGGAFVNFMGAVFSILFKYALDQPLPVPEVESANNTYAEIVYPSMFNIDNAYENETSAAFVHLDPVAAEHCGCVCMHIVGTIKIWHRWTIGSLPTITVENAVDFDVTIAFPWFIE